MTGGFLSVPAMRPNRCWTVLCASVLAALLLTLNADSEDSDCDLQIKVHRNTRFEVFLGKELRINCAVVFCNSSPPEISWYKFEKTAAFSPVNVSSNSRIQTEWKSLKHLEGISYLIFQKTLLSDSGAYRCQAGPGGSMSHSINVTVNDSVVGDKEPINDTQKNGTKIIPPGQEDLMIYVYAGAGIVVFVILVIIISVASMQGCKGKPKTETRTDNQYMAIPMIDQPFQQSPRGSPSVQLPRRSTRKKAQPSESPSPRNNDLVYGQVQQDRERQRNLQEEEGASVVYAALNHQLPARAAARPQRQMEETSEYAAIRV